MDYRHLIVGILCAAIVCACVKQDPFERELGLQSRLVELSSEGGITPVIVFSNTSWHAKFVTPVSWASIDRLSGEGSSQVKVAFAGNYGCARKVSVAFEAGSARDTLVLIQGSGVPSPFISFNPSSLNVGADVVRGKVILSTNIQENINEVKASVTYPDGGDEGWISDVRFSESSLEFSMTENTAPVSRAATITLLYKDAYDKEIKAQLFITQNPA